MYQRSSTSIYLAVPSADHHVQVADIKAISGPTVTLYKVYPAKGVKVAAIRNLHEDIAVALESGTIRAHTLTDSVGLEVPNITRSLVPVRSLVSSPEFKESKAELPIAIGSSTSGGVHRQGIDFIPSDPDGNGLRPFGESHVPAGGGRDCRSAEQQQEQGSPRSDVR